MRPSLILAMAGLVGAKRSDFEQILGVVAHVASLVQDTMQEDHSTDVIQSVKSLAQHSKATPGVKPGLKGALSNIVSEIETKVQGQIKKEAQKRQATLEEWLSNVKQSSRSAMTSKTAADAADAELSTCIEGERNKLALWEGETKELGSVQAAVAAPCKEAEDASEFAWDMQTKIAMDCDMATDAQCSRSLASLGEDVDDIIAKVQAQLAGATNVYNTHAAMCTQAKDEAAAQKRVQVKAEQSYKIQREYCAGLDETRDLRVCQFGDWVQKKCYNVDTFRKHLAEIDRTQPDMVKQWNTAHVTKCMLNLVMTQGEVDSVGMSECAATAHYGKDVQPLKRREVALERWLLEETFTCKEQSFKFSDGQEWVVPNVVGATSGAYKKTQAILSFDVKQANPPFEMCKPEE